MLLERLVSALLDAAAAVAADDESVDEAKADEVRLRLRNRLWKVGVVELGVGSFAVARGRYLEL